MNSRFSYDHMPARRQHNEAFFLKPSEDPDKFHFEKGKKYSEQVAETGPSSRIGQNRLSYNRPVRPTGHAVVVSVRNSASSCFGKARHSAEGKTVSRCALAVMPKPLYWASRQQGQCSPHLSASMKRLLPLGISSQASRSRHACGFRLEF